MEKERSSNSEIEHDDIAAGNSSPEEWFKSACYLASQGKQKEAELAILRSLSLQDEYPVAWAILSAILLAQGRETDAEQAGKKAIAQCKKLKMTWPKMRTIILSKGIIRGATWKDPRKVVIENDTNNEWGNLLSTLGEISQQDVHETSKPGEATSWQDRTYMYDLAETKLYDLSEKKYDSPADAENLTKREEAKELEIYIDYAKRSETQSRPREPRKIRESDIIEKPKVTEKAPESFDAATWFTAAESYLKSGNLAKAEEAFLKALEIDPSRGDAWLQVSSLLMGKQKYDEAIATLKNATERMPQNSAAWYQLGYCYQKLNKWSEAIEPLKRATLLAKNKPEFWMALGLSEFHLARYQFSAKSLLRVLRISPDHKKALFYLAMCMEKQGNRQHALSLNIKLLNLGGLEPGMLQRMADAFQRLNRPREAREAKRRADVALRAGIQ